MHFITGSYGTPDSSGRHRRIYSAFQYKSVSFSSFASCGYSRFVTCGKWHWLTNPSRQQENNPMLRGQTWRVCPTPYLAFIALLLPTHCPRRGQWVGNATAILACFQLVTLCLRAGVTKANLTLTSPCEVKVRFDRGFDARSSGSCMRLACTG